MDSYPLADDDDDDDDDKQRRCRHCGYRRCRADDGVG
jgi:hypothetical protein